METVHSYYSSEHYAITAFCAVAISKRRGMELMLCRNMPIQFHTSSNSRVKAPNCSHSQAYWNPFIHQTRHVEKGEARGEAIVHEIKQHEKYLPPSLHLVLLFNYGMLLFGWSSGKLTRNFRD